MRIAVCDDDIYMLNRVGDIVLSLCTEWEEVVVDRFSDCLELLQAHRKQPYQVLFSDIQMPQMDGFNLSQELVSVFRDLIVVYITNHDHLVFQSLAFHPTYFVRKEKLQDDMKRAFAEVVKEYRARYDKVYFDCRKGDEWQAMCLPIGQIRYVMSQGRRIYVVTDSDKYTGRGMLSDWKKKLEENGFAYCHSSYLVNIARVVGITNEDLLLDSGERIPLSRRRLRSIKADIVERGVIRI